MDYVCCKISRITVSLYKSTPIVCNVFICLFLLHSKYLLHYNLSESDHKGKRSRHVCLSMKIGGIHAPAASPVSTPLLYTTVKSRKKNTNSVNPTKYFVVDVYDTSKYSLNLPKKELVGSIAHVLIKSNKINMPRINNLCFFVFVFDVKIGNLQLSGRHSRFHS